MKSFLALSSRSAALRRQFHSNAPSPSASRRQQHEGESRSVRVSVWWDFENCHPPQGSHAAFKVAHSITAAVRASGIKGPVQITAFGDVAQLSRANQEAMSATGISLTHIPSGGKNSADRSLLIDLMCWVSHNPPPAHLFLISGDRDFATVLHRLRMSNYNILLAGPESAPGVLCSAASIVWQWSTLAKGENITGKYFNQPPDGPYNSWYGYYKVPLENPFAVIEQPTCQQPEEIPESIQDPKPRPVPKTAMKQVRNVLCSHPKGISITDLRSELGRCNIDKDLYGYKKFSRFLLSMPHILKLQSGPDGQLFVHSATPKLPELAEPSHVKKEPESVPTPMVDIKGINGKPSLSRAAEQNVKPYENIEKPSLTSTIEVSIKPEEDIKKPSSPGGIEKNIKLNEKIGKIDKAGTSKEPSHIVETCNPTPGVGFFGRTWRQWLYGMDGVSEIETSRVQNTGKNVKVDEFNFSSTSQIKDAVEQFSKFSSSDGKSTEKNSVVSVADSDKATEGVGVFKRVTAWCLFWRETPTDKNSSSAQSGDNFEPATVDSGKHKLFLQESFWKELEAHLDTPPNGSVLVLHSMSREQMAHNLQKHGPSVLKPLSQSDLLQLVDLLITEKRWVEECLSQAYPFKLVLPPKHSSSPTTPNKSALRSAFMGLSSSSISETVPKNYGESKSHNLPHTGVSASITDKKTRGFNKSRNDVLSDCQKLVEKIVKENPGGFNMGCFRKCFLDAYSYPLDIQKLGYQKLVTLLQIMPGVKVEESYIFPACNKASGLEIANVFGENNHNRVLSKSGSESSEPLNKNDDLDATWDELGPVAFTGSNQNKEFGSQKSAKAAIGKRLNRDFEALADDYISDSEEETSSVTGSELPEKSRENQEDSSLVRILGSWYSTKEEKDTKKEDTKQGSENEDTMVDNSENGSKGSLGSYGCGGLVMKTEVPFSRYGTRPKSTTKISFVSEQSGNGKDKLIDGILGSLKKSCESRIHG